MGERGKWGKGEEEHGGTGFSLCKGGEEGGRRQAQSARRAVWPREGARGRARGRVAARGRAAGENVFLRNEANSPQGTGRQWVMAPNRELFPAPSGKAPVGNLSAPGAPERGHASFRRKGGLLFAECRRGEKQHVPWQRSQQEYAGGALSAAISHCWCCGRVVGSPHPGMFSTEHIFCRPSGSQCMMSERLTRLAGAAIIRLASEETCEDRR